MRALPFMRAIVVARRIFSTTSPACRQPTSSGRMVCLLNVCLTALAILCARPFLGGPLASELRHLCRKGGGSTRRFRPRTAPVVRGELPVRLLPPTRVAGAARLGRRVTPTTRLQPTFGGPTAATEAPRFLRHKRRLPARLRPLWRWRCPSWTRCCGGPSIHSATPMAAGEARMRILPPTRMAVARLATDATSTTDLRRLEVTGGRTPCRRKHRLCLPGFERRLRLAGDKRRLRLSRVVRASHQGRRMPASRPIHRCQVGGATIRGKATTRPTTPRLAPMTRGEPPVHHLPPTGSIGALRLVVSATSTRLGSSSLARCHLKCRPALRGIPPAAHHLGHAMMLEPSRRCLGGEATTSPTAPTTTPAVYGEPRARLLPPTRIAGGAILGRSATPTTRPRPIRGGPTAATEAPHLRLERSLPLLAALRAARLRGGSMKLEPRRRCRGESASTRPTRRRAAARPSGSPLTCCLPTTRIA
mmetsp:Transcript_13347/g.28824  ORF Transcript_13347/g.28824 Transcript_13347/m.28824 type:complete len:475 (-) Transcript_13347:404-1828(-)